jgi:predicted GNAT family acetyltransferase
VSGQPRLTREADLPLMTAWWGDFASEALEAMPPEAALAGARAHIGGDWSMRGSILWEHDGQPVCLVAWKGPTPSGMRIGPVYTPPLRRGRGYASAATAYVTHMLLEHGRRAVYLYADSLNPTSNKIYQAIGYTRVSEANEYLFRPVAETAAGTPERG